MAKNSLRFGFATGLKLRYSARPLQRSYVAGGKRRKTLSDCKYVISKGNYLTMATLSGKICATIWWGSRVAKGIRL